MDIKEAYQIMQRASGIEVGDTVKVLRINKSEELGSVSCHHTQKEHDWQDTLTGTVTEVEPSCVWVRVGSPYKTAIWCLPFFVLEIIEKAKEAKKEKMITVNGKDFSESTIALALKQYVNE